MKNRNRNLLILLLTLFTANVLLAIWPENRSEFSYDEALFAIKDTSGIQKINLGENVILERKSSGWHLNGAYPANPSLVRILLSIFNRVSIKKPIDQTPDNQTQVTVSGKTEQQFIVWGNPTKTRTYFKLAGAKDAYEVHIPGYSDYLADIFELEPLRWRDRVLIDASWRTIQKLELNYTQSAEKDLSIEFDKQFFRVAGLQAIDSNQVVNYLNQFQMLQVNEWLEAGVDDRYDSLSRMPPLALLTIETINDSSPILLEIFPKLPGEHFHLLMSYDKSMMLIDERRAGYLLIAKSDLAFKEESAVRR